MTRITWMARQVGLILIFSAFSGTCFSKDTVTWLEYELPPGYISSGSNERQGFANKSIQWLQQQLPQWQHHTKIATIPRLLVMARMKQDVCSCILKNPEREATLHFSAPIMQLSPHRLFFLTKNKAELEAKLGMPLNQQVSLATIMEHLDKVSFSVASGRSYGASRDAILNQHHDEIQVSTQSKLSSQFISRLVANRLDFIIEYPWLITYEQSQMGFKERTLSSVAIEESAPMLDVYIACAKTANGAQVIESINQNRIQASCKKETSTFKRKIFFPSSRSSSTVTMRSSSASWCPML